MTLIVMQRKDLSFVSRVLWAPHSFFAAVMWLLGVCLIYAALRVIDLRQDRFTEDAALRVAAIASTGAAAFYWIPNAVAAYAHLRLARRLASKSEAQWDALTREERRAEQVAQHNAGGRPSASDSPASDTPSSPAPRG